VNAREVPPLWRWGAVLWLAIWVPSYARTWGWANFLAYCDMAVLVTCVGLWLGSARLLSSQALATVPFGALWAIDAGSRLLTGRHLFGGTEYLWNGSVPLLVRLLSLFHLVLPVVVLLALRRTGYERRGFSVQIAITAVLLCAARALAPARNLNYAFADPLLHKPWGPPPLHLLAMLVGMTVVIYLPVHLLLRRAFRRA
jgi:hypothetical protein